MRYDGTLLFIDPVIEVKSEDDPAISECGPKLQHELPLRATEVERADLVLLTHSHGDHAAPKTLSVLKETGAVFVCPEICLPMLDRIGVDRARVWIVDYDHEWPCRGQKMTHREVSIEPVRAIHGDRRGVPDMRHGMGAGYVVKVGPHSVFHPGDTVLMGEHYELEDIEILLLPICEHSGTLKALPKILAPKRTIPMHYDTYEVNEDNRFWTYGNPEEIKPSIGYPEKLTILKQGEAFRPH